MGRGDLVRGSRQLLVTVASLVFASSITVVHSASAISVDRCGETIDSRPVTLSVHGFAGRPGVWEESSRNGSMNDSVKMVNGVKLVAAFDYQVYNTKWVTDPHIGTALAERINCLSDASKEAGGDGRIIVLAHSMGGLALREALNQGNAVYVKPEKIGLAIMLGTPHNGSDVSYFGGVVNLCLPKSGGVGYGCATSPAIRAMRPGSRELAMLPKLPASVALRSIAGDAVVSQYVWGYKVVERHYGDKVVRVSSATAQYTTAYPGDGKFVFECEAGVSFGLPQGTPCDHTELLKNGQMQASVIQALGEYVNSLPDSEPTPSPSVSTPGGCGQPTPNETASEEAIGGVGSGPTETPCS